MTFSRSHKNPGKPVGVNQCRPPLQLLRTSIIKAPPVIFDKSVPAFQWQACTPLCMCWCQSPSKSQLVGWINRQNYTDMGRWTKRRTTHRTPPHAATAMQRKLDQCDSQLSSSLHKIPFLSLSLGNGSKCCKLAQCWTSSTCLRLGFVGCGKEKTGKIKKEFHIWQF